MIGSVYCVTAILVSVAVAADIEAVAVTPDNAGHDMQFNWNCTPTGGKMYCSGDVNVLEDLNDITMTTSRQQCDMSLSNCQPYSNETTPNLCGVPPGTNSPWAIFIGAINYNGQCPLAKGDYPMKSIYITPAFLPNDNNCWIDTYDTMASNQLVGVLQMSFCVPQ